MNDPLAQRLSLALGSSFTLEGEIGRGGMGVVYRARDERLKRGVAVKVLPPELAFREEIRIRFLREAETAARLSHPHIVPIHSVGEGPDGLVYFVMAFVDGESVAGKLKRRGRLPAGEARRVILETSDALCGACAPVSLAAACGCSIEKDPEDPWPPAGALRRALEARNANVYLSRRPSAGAASRATRFPPPPSRPVPRSPNVGGGVRGRRPTRPQREAVQLAPGGEADIVRKMRSSFVSWASVAGGCLLFDAATGGHGWSLFVAVPWGAFGLLPLY